MSKNKPEITLIGIYKAAVKSHRFTAKFIVDDKQKTVHFGGKKSMSYPESKDKKKERCL